MFHNFYNYQCKDTEIKQPKPTQNNEICTVQPSPNQCICERVDQTKREGSARGQKQERKTKGHELMYEIGLLQACLKRQILPRRKYCSLSSLSILVLDSLLFSFLFFWIPFSRNFISLIYSLPLYILTPHLYLTKFSS